MEKLYYSYNDIHNLIKTGFNKLTNNNPDFKPDYILAIVGGGMIPSRILRTFINVPIISLTVSYYDEENKIRLLPKIIQWVDREMIKGKNILIVDEVDDTRKTLSYLIDNFRKYVKQLGIFVVNNKKKEKVISIPEDVIYLSCVENEDVWINYPWDNTNFID